MTAFQNLRNVLRDLKEYSGVYGVVATNNYIYFDCASGRQKYIVIGIEVYVLTTEGIYKKRNNEKLVDYDDLVDRLHEMLTEQISIIKTKDLSNVL